jgi:hypothetical protein
MAKNNNRAGGVASARTPAWQARGPEFKPHATKKKPTKKIKTETSAGHGDSFL